MIGLPTLSPAPLANATIEAIISTGWSPGAEFLHYATGVIVSPLGWLVGVEPISRRLAPGMPWIVAATAYGVLLWAFALYAMADLVAGMPPFLGFGPVAKALDRASRTCLFGHARVRGADSPRV